MENQGQLKEKQHLQQIIAGLTQGVILVDTDGSIAWANKVALELHRVDKVTGLGKTVSQYSDMFKLRYRNNHVLDPDQYPLARAARSEFFADVIVQVYPTDESEPLSVQSAGSLVVTDPEGRADYFALILTNVADQVEAEQRFEAAFRANPAPALICRLSDRRFIKANAGFVEMTGWAREQIVGKSVEEFDLFNQSEKRELCLERLNAGETVPQSESCLALPGKNEKYVIVAGQPMEVSGEPCMLFTFADLDPRKNAEAELKHSEQRFSVSFKQSPVAQVIASANGLKILVSNAKFLSMTGLSETESIGRGLVELNIWEDNDQHNAIEKALERDGRVETITVSLRSRPDLILDCLFSAETVLINTEKCVLCSFQDITERKKTEDELLEAIDSVMSNGWFGRTVIEKLNAFRSVSNGKSSAAVRDLSRREREIFEYIGQGLSDGEIADQLSISRNTVRNHVASVYSKLAINRRADAVILARQNAISPPIQRQK